MKLKTKFKDLFLIQNKSFKDKRGYFKELIRENKIHKNFPFLVMSFSKKNVIRGLHIQTNDSQGKFVSVIKGKIFDVAIDLRKVSKTYGKVHKCILSEKNKRSIFAIKDIKKGEKFTKENIRVLRPRVGLAPLFYDKILSKKATKKIKKNDPIKLNFF